MFASSLLRLKPSCRRADKTPTGAPAGAGRAAGSENQDPTSNNPYPTSKSMRRLRHKHPGPGPRDSGQSLVLVTLAMAVILAVAALAIDAASWRNRHHQTQVVADAAALAAANCLAHPGTSATSIVTDGTRTSVPACSSSTDTADATTVAEDYARANGVTITPSQITFNTSTDTVTISATATSPSFFAGVFGIGSTHQTAGAQARWTAGSSSCSTPGESCAAVFAMGTSCVNSDSVPNGSPIIFNGSSDTIAGAVHSNGSIYEAGGGGQTLGPTSFGNGSGCEIDTDYETGDTWNGSSTKPSTGSPPITSWPEDFTKVVTPCGSSYSYACTGPYGTPSYCTQAAGTKGYSSANGAGSAGGFDYGSKSENPASGQVWCAYGSGNPADPSTWNGLIYLQSDSIGVTGNWIGGTIEFGQNGWDLSPQLQNFPVLYATGSGDCSNGNNGGVCMTGGSQTINGSVFAPNGWIQFNGAGTTTENFLEGQGIDFIGGNQSIVGTGPTNIGGPSSPGTDSL